jgi:hypothetical protein
VARRLRLRLLGDDWSAFGGLNISDDRVVEVSEEAAVAFLRDRSSARTVEVLGWVHDHADPEAELPSA